MTVNGILAVSDGFTTCAAGRRVSLQEWKAGEWWTIRTANTDGSGHWTHTWMADPGASYRLLAPERSTSDYECDPTSSLTFIAS